MHLHYQLTTGNYIYQIKPLKQEGNIVLENKLKILPSLNFLVFNCMPPEH